MNGFSRRTAVCLVVGWLCVPAALRADGWPDERTAGIFTFHADFSLENYGELLTEMGQLQRDLTRTLGVAESRESVHLFLFRKQNTYQRYMNHYFRDVPQRRALFIKGRGPGMVFAYYSDDFAIDVRHESTHALLHAALPMVPLWLDEGLAEYFEVSPNERAHDNSHLKSTKWAVQFGQSGNLERLEQIGDLADMGRSEYRQAWSWVHFLLHESPESHAELVRFLGDIQAQTPPGKLSERLRRRFPDLDRRYADHFRKWKR